VGAARLMRQSTLDMVPPSAGGAWTSPQSDELQFGVPSGVRQRIVRGGCTPDSGHAG
jgi:hypothetical protein